MAHQEPGRCRLPSLAQLAQPCCLAFLAFRPRQLRIVTFTILATRLRLCFCIAQVVDLFGAHAAKTVIDKNAVRQTEASVEQQWIDGVIARLIPPHWIAPGTPHMMLERGVHDLVGQHPGQCCRVQRIDKIGIKVERHAISRHGWNRPTLSPLQAKQKRAKERMVEQ